MKRIKIFKTIICVVSVLALCVIKLFGSEQIFSYSKDNSQIKECIITFKNERTCNIVKEGYKNSLVDEYICYESSQDKVLHMGLSKTQIHELEKLKGVDAIEENIDFKASNNSCKRVKSSRRSADDWNLRMIGADKIRRHKPSEENRIKVALMDSGIDVSEEVNVVERINLVDNEKQIASYYEDVTGHGTSVAGIIADINPDIDVYSVRVLDSTNTGKLSYVIEGIYWCINNDIDIINMSFGTNINSIALQKAVEKAEEAGILMVAAAGNGGQNKTVEYPAAYAEVMAVGGIDKNAETTDDSVIGEEIEIVAPGSQILTDGAFGGTLVTGGTSMAVAHVSGAASLIWQKDKEKSSRFVRSLINHSAKKLGEKKVYGNGLLDIKYALKKYNMYQKVYIEKDFEPKKNVIAENTTDIEIFDKVDLVEGRWNSNGHKTVLDIANGDVGFTADEMWVIKDACAKTDGIIDHGNAEVESVYHFKTNTDKILHGRYNYVSTLEYIYKVARKVYNTGDDITIKSCCNSFGYTPNTGNASKDSEIKNALVAAIRYMGSASTPIVNPSSISWRQKRGLRILGMALHVVGDTYAHKTKVPRRIQQAVQKSENSVAATDLIRNQYTWDEFKSAVDAGMMFNQIKIYVGSGYEDTDYFFGNRYNAACRASNAILRHFAVKSERVDMDVVFRVAAIFENGALCEENKLAYFYKHVNNTYGYSRAVDIKGYSFVPASGEYVS